MQINIETSLCMIGIITLNSQYNHISVVIKEVVIRSPFCKHFNDQKLQSYIHHSRATECLQSNSVVQIMQFLLSQRDPFMGRCRLINPSFMLIEIRFAKWHIRSYSLKFKQHWASSVLGWVTIWLGCSNPSIGTSFNFFYVKVIIFCQYLKNYIKFSKIFNFYQNLKYLRFLPKFE